MVLQKQTITNTLFIVHCGPLHNLLFQVAARTVIGMGEYGSTATGTTQPNYPSEPIGLTEYHRNASCLTIEWEEPITPNGQIRRYKVAHSIDVEI